MNLHSIYVNKQKIMKTTNSKDQYAACMQASGKGKRRGIHIGLRVINKILIIH